jgi:large subunit ribosomal protein L21
MYAIVDIAGQQFKVEKDQEIFVHRLDGEEGSKVKFNDVMLLDNEGKVVVGTPFVKGASISAKILSHEKGDKVTVFHKKRRKGYQKANGHRQFFSKIQIEAIAEKEVAAKKETAKKAAPKKEEVKAEKVVAEKKETVKKAAPKKAAAPKAKKETAAPKAKASTKETDK